MTDTPAPSLHDTLATARTRLANIRTAVAEAEARASATEQARIAAEKVYVDRVADAMMDGETTPAKSAALVKLQNDDDIAEAALESLKQRVSQIDGELRSAAAKVLHDEARKLSSLRATQASDACSQIIPAFQMLVRAVGVSDAQAIVQQLAADGSWAITDAEYHGDLNAIHRLVPEMGGAQVVVGDLDAAAVRPRRANIGEHVLAFLKNHNAEGE